MDAFKAEESAGRRYEEDYAVKIENPFLEDFVRIMNSKGYRRLPDKTQVISVPRNSYVRTRATHTGEVMAIAVTISEALGLNTSLCLSGAAGHDIGHAPYGHVGEEVISEVLGKKFTHSIGGVVVSQHIERTDGRGLNLSFETLECILNHSRTRVPLTMDLGFPNEYSAVMLADKIAYTFSDVNDAIRYGYVSELPDFVLRLGKNQERRVNNVLRALIEESGSERKDRVSFSEGDVFDDFTRTRAFMHNEFYFKMNHEIKKVILRKAYEFFSTNPFFSDINPAALLLMLTDKDANRIGQIMSESGRCTLEDIKGLGIFDSASRLRGKTIDLTNPDLDWGKERRKINQ